jgi:hypothetical protein
VGEEDLNPEFTRCVEKGKIVTFAKGPSLASWPGLFWRTMSMNFDSRVWGCAGGDIEEVRELHLGHR